MGELLRMQVPGQNHRMVIKSNHRAGHLLRLLCWEGPARPHRPFPHLPTSTKIPRPVQAPGPCWRAGWSHTPPRVFSRSPSCQLSFLGISLIY